MNTFYRNIAAFALAATLCLAPQASAQVALTQTLTTLAITDVATKLTVASTTGITANVSFVCIYDFGMPGCELAQIKAVVSSTVLTLLRVNGTAHAIGSVVLIAPKANAFRSFNPRGSTCVAAQTGYTPWVNTNTGEQWLCGAYGWVRGWKNKSVDAQLNSATATASVGGATAITGPLVEISGTEAITSFTMGVGWAGDGFCVQPSAAFTTTATNNIAEATTADANQTLCFTWNARLAAFTSSY